MVDATHSLKKQRFDVYIINLSSIIKLNFVSGNLLTVTKLRKACSCFEHVKLGPELMIVIYDKKGFDKLLVVDESKLINADLRDAFLKDANLVQYDLRGTDLRGANLAGADMRLADLSNADLRGANLAGADLTGAILENTQMDTGQEGVSKVIPIIVKGSG